MSDTPRTDALVDTFRPILGAKVEHLEALRYPLFASFKLDGIRAIWWGKEFISRTLKTIPNRSLQRIASKLEIPSGWDGELIFGEPNAADVYRKTTSACMTVELELSNYAAPLRFFTFDNCEDSREFASRQGGLYDIPSLVVKLDQTICDNPQQVLDLEQRAIAQGYEGLVLRDPRGPYKRGRSTLREQYLLKLKRFHDFEAEVIGFEELEHNANELTTDERGYAKRSSHAENKIAMGVLGALVCRTMEGVEFRVGTGFSQRDRGDIWRHRDRYLGQLAKIKSLPIGVKDKPRHPVWLGWRSKIDT